MPNFTIVLHLISLMSEYKIETEIINLLFYEIAFPRGNERDKREKGITKMRNVFGRKRSIFSKMSNPVFKYNKLQKERTYRMKKAKEKRPKTPIEAHMQQREALRRVRSLNKNRKTPVKRMHRQFQFHIDREKTPFLTPEKRYSIEKLNQNHEIDFMSQNIRTKELHRKNCSKQKLQRLVFQAVIGFGNFGRVWKAKDKTCQKYFAVKEINKPQILNRKGLATTMNEREVLPKLNFHLIPGLISSFQSDLSLYIVLPLLERGDLRYHITKFKEFDEKTVRFFAACLVSTFEYLRHKGIIHRDIKPQNLLLDVSGYLYLTDFGICQKIEDVRAGLCCGTPAYMSPEIMFEKEYGFESDYYGMGIFLYEMMMGERPYLGSKLHELKKEISKKSGHLKKDRIPEGWSVEAADFINRLLHRNPCSRLGSKGIDELKQHPWLRGFPWDLLSRKQIMSPYQQIFIHEEVNYEEMIKQERGKEVEEIETALSTGKMQELFQFFTFEGLEKSTEWTTKPSTELRLHL